MSIFFKTCDIRDKNRTIYDIVLHPLMYAPEPFLDNFFINKIFELKEVEYSALYNHHSKFFLDNQKKGVREDFFRKVMDIVTLTRSEIIMQSRKTLFSIEKVKLDSRRNKLDKFIKTISEYDEWGILESESERNKKLQEENKALTRLLSEITVEPHHKIDIKNGNKKNLIALFHDLIDIEHPKNSDKVTISTTAIKTWAKIVSLYFTENGKAIPLETALNYFDGTSKLKKSDRIYNISYIDR